MPSSSTYSIDKINAFKAAKLAYENEKEIYMNSLKSFQSDLNNVTQLHKNSSGKPEFVEQNGQYSTAEGIVIQDNTNITDNVNTINSDGNYVSSISTDISNINSEYTKSNTFVQMGLDELQYNENTFTKNVYKFSNDITPSVENQSNCSIDDVYQCDSYAKMTNKPYYGITEENESTCKCYTFSDESQIGTKFTENIKTYEITQINGVQYSSMSYLGVLFDKGLYSLKDSNYSNNFDKLYEVNDNIKILNDDMKTNVCNPFSGSGLSRLNIKDLGFLRCENI